MGGRAPISRTSVTERAVLEHLSGAQFSGSVALLAVRLGVQERHAWLAVAGLLARDLATARKLSDDQVKLTLTAQGRQLVGRLVWESASSGRHRTRGARAPGRSRRVAF